MRAILGRQDGHTAQGHTVLPRKRALLKITAAKIPPMVTSRCLLYAQGDPSQDQVGKFSEKNPNFWKVSFFIWKSSPFFVPKSAIQLGNFIHSFRLLVGFHPGDPATVSTPLRPMFFAFKVLGLDPGSKSWCPGLQFWCFLNICIVLGIDHFSGLLFSTWWTLSMWKITTPATWNLEILCMEFCMTLAIMTGKFESTIVKTGDWGLMLQTGDRSSIVDKSCVGLKHLVEISWSFGKSVAMSGQEKVGEAPQRALPLNPWPPTLLHKESWSLGS